MKIMRFPLLFIKFSSLATLFLCSRVLSQVQVPMKKADRPLMDPLPTPPTVTHIVYLDIQQIIQEPKETVELGRIVLGLFGNVAPKTVENFYSLCKCDKGLGKYSHKPLCYKNTYFHRIIPNFIVQGGDITHSGTGGESIYGGKFDDESFEIRHNKRYLLSMANSGRNNNGSQFFITTVKTSWLDGKNVVFGMVIDGFHVVDSLETLGTNSGTPSAKAVIMDSGVLSLDYLETLSSTTH